ncbi:MAG: dihydropteroate synthase [Bacteroidales bacterium]|nr:dihydropteroate synthase [Bacteroidales bacterium]
MHFPGGKILKFTNPAVMGILNITPDSFYDGAWFLKKEDGLRQCEKMLNDGADIIDIGAVSTRPGAKEVSPDDELSRLESVVRLLRKTFPEIILSVDTYRASVAEFAISEGVDIINDISGGTLDERMFEVVAAHQVGYVLMHISGHPETMQVNPCYSDVVEEVRHYFFQRLNLLHSAGKSENIILDPGFGFGKTLEHNYRLLAHISEFQKPGFPVMAGLSRKSMINGVLGTRPETALQGTVSLNTIALLNGVDILRVHDVKEAFEAIRIAGAYREFNA